MREYQRTTNARGDIFQWTSAEACMVLDAVTGEPQRFGKHQNSVGYIEEALEYVKHRPGWEDRMVIVRLSAIRGYPVNGNVSQ